MGENGACTEWGGADVSTAADGGLCLEGAAWELLVWPQQLRAHGASRWIRNARTTSGRHGAFDTLGDTLLHSLEEGWFTAAQASGGGLHLHIDARHIDSCY